MIRAHPRIGTELCRIANSLLIDTFERRIWRETRWIAPRRSPVRVRLAPFREVPARGRVFAGA